MSQGWESSAPPFPDLPGPRHFLFAGQLRGFRWPPNPPSNRAYAVFSGGIGVTGYTLPTESPGTGLKPRLADALVRGNGDGGTEGQGERTSCFRVQRSHSEGPSGLGFKEQA